MVVLLLGMTIIWAKNSVDTSRFVISTDTVLKNDLIISPGKSLVINEGVTIRLDGYRSIVIQGLLIACGTDSRPIVFASVDRARGSADRPTWNGLEVRGKDAHARLRHCRIEGAFRNLIWEANAVFDSCKFAGNHYGLYAAKKTVPQVQNCVFYLNTYAVASDFASPIIAGNTFTNNVIGIYQQLGSSAYVTKNIFSANQTDIKLEESLGKNNSMLSTQHLWDVMRQCF
ncbi:MAG: right-handed parallel beta-helix repeat-containing protein [Fibrobacterota bacterium]